MIFDLEIKTHNYQQRQHFILKKSSQNIIILFILYIYIFFLIFKRGVGVNNLYKKIFFSSRKVDLHITQYEMIFSHNQMNHA